jgi:hypothetical protein
MSISIANLNPTSDTFQSWVNKTNQLADAMSTIVLTSAANTIGGQNSANLYLNGTLSANIIAAGQVLRGGSVSSSGNLNITSNTSFTGANVDINSTYITLTTSGNTTLSSVMLNISGTAVNVTSNVNFKSDTLTVYTAGRVGINTTNPDASIQVVGTANVSGNVAFGNKLTVIGNAIVGNVFFVDTSRGLTYDSTGYAFVSSANVQTSGTLVLSNTTSNTIVSSGNIALTGTAVLVGSVTGQSNTCARSIGFAYNQTAAANSARMVTGGGALTGDITINIYSDSAATANTIVVRDSLANFTANTITANLTGIANTSTYLFYNSGYRSATDTNTGNSIVARDVNGSFSANILTATATTARYADLAENYLADAVYSIGTVIAVGGPREVTVATEGMRAIGVVSEHPAYLMNDTLSGGTAIALKGRVPVRVIGPVSKNMGLMPAQNGCAKACGPLDIGVFGIALETSVDVNEKMVEAVIL